MIDFILSLIPTIVCTVTGAIRGYEIEQISLNCILSTVILILWRSYKNETN